MGTVHVRKGIPQHITQPSAAHQTLPGRQLTSAQQHRFEGGGAKPVPRISQTAGVEKSTGHPVSMSKDYNPVYGALYLPFERRYWKCQIKLQRTRSFSDIVSKHYSEVM